MTMQEDIRRADVLVVGAGLTGATYANKLKTAGYKVVVIDKRDHIAGNAYTSRENGIDIHKYGAHIFHTPNKEIWDYITSFGEFNDYVHHVQAIFDEQVFSLPFTLKTMSEVFERQFSPAQAKKHLAMITARYQENASSSLEAKALSLVGDEIYTMLIETYTKKQWNTDPTELDSSIITRLPFRMNYDTRYFNDKYQGIPVDGYTKIVERMLEGIRVYTGIDFFELDLIDSPYIIYTGPVDRYFNYMHGELKWRSVKFETEYHEEVEDFQGIPVMNHCDDTVDYTRVIEHKHFNPLPDQKGTYVSYEYSCEPSDTIDPYYPVNVASEREKMKSYEALKDLAKPNVHVCGRLGDFKYYDMHQAIGIVFKDLPEIRKRIFEHNNRW